MLELIDYSLRILPSVVVLGVLYLLFRDNRDASLPILVRGLLSERE